MPKADVLKFFFNSHLFIRNFTDAVIWILSMVTSYQNVEWGDFWLYLGAMVNDHWGKFRLVVGVKR